MSAYSYELGQWRSNIFMLILPSYSVGSEPSIISNTETQRDSESHNQPGNDRPGDISGILTLWVGPWPSWLVMVLMTEVRSWVSLQLFGLSPYVSPWDLGLLGSRHSEACPHTGNTRSVCNNDTSVAPPGTGSNNSSSCSDNIITRYLYQVPATINTTNTMMPPKLIGSSLMLGRNE